MDGEAVKMPSLPGKYRNSTELANLDSDSATYANLQNMMESDSPEDAVPVTKFAGFSDKRQRSFRKAVDIFAELEKDTVRENEPTSPTGKSPPTAFPKSKKPAVPGAKPVVSLKPSSTSGKPPPAAKPGRNAERPVPKERRHMPAEARRKSGPPLDDSLSAVHNKHVMAKEQVQRSISVGLSEPPDQKGMHPKHAAAPAMMDKKQFALNQSKLTEVFAAAAIRPSGGVTRRTDERSKSMRRPPFSPPKPPTQGGTPPKPPPASAKPGKDRRARSHDYEPVGVGEFPLADKDSSPSREDNNRLPVHLTQVQKTNLKQFADDDSNGSSGEPKLSHSNSIRRSQPPAVPVDLRGGSGDIDARGPKTLPRQPSNVSEYAYARNDEVAGRVEKMLKEKEAGRALNTGKAKVYASAYSEVELQSPGISDKDSSTTAAEVDHKLKVMIPGKELPPAKPTRGKPSQEVSGAYELVAPGGFPPAPAVGGKNGSTASEDDVFSKGGTDGMYGEYNDVNYIDGKR